MVVSYAKYFEERSAVCLILFEPADQARNDAGGTSVNHMMLTVYLSSGRVRGLL